MKKVLKNLIVAATVALSAGASISANAVTLDELLMQVKKDRISEGQLNKQREKEFKAAQADKKALLAKAKKALRDEKARGVRLKNQYAENEVTLSKKAEELENAKGTLGEMFGVVRRTSADTIGSIEASIVSAQYPGREELLRGLAAAKELPTTRELEELWIALQTEMTESGKVAKFQAQVNKIDGTTAMETVTRVGSFNLMSGSNYLIYSSENKNISMLGREADSHYRASIGAFNSASAGEVVALYVDPTRGSLLRLNTQKATFQERYEAGGTVGYIITGVLILGLLLALERLVTLTIVTGGIKKQLRDTTKPNTSNPLGRILKVYEDNKSADVENLELKLDEATLRELPRIERNVNVIKILAAIAPLLGLLGTVVGMIETFQQITLFGTGDPKIMAGSISMALVTTAEGLIAALPLIFVHSIVAAKSKSVLHIIDEQTAGIIATHAEKERA